MKKLALFAATMICFAGCARNDTGDMTEDTSSGTAVGTPATSQSESSMSRETGSPGLDTNTSSSTLNRDTNNQGQAAPPQSGAQNPSPLPTPPAPDQQQQQPQQGQPPQP